MNYKFDEFIGIFNNVYPEGYCEHLISQFEYLEKKGLGINRLQGEGAPSIFKDDHQIRFNFKDHPVEPFENKDIVDIFFNGLQSCFDEYQKKFSILTTDKLTATHMKMQRTSSGGGYHIWHHEHSWQNPNRVLVYLLYLNSLKPENCGETEFLYQQKRYNPIQNSMIIWPAAYTHTHRGNPVHGDVHKYVATGWFYFY